MLVFMLSMFVSGNDVGLMSRLFGMYAQYVMYPVNFMVLFSADCTSVPVSTHWAKSINLTSVGVPPPIGVMPKTTCDRSTFVPMEVTLIADVSLISFPGLSAAFVPCGILVPSTVIVDTVCVIVGSWM